METILCQDVRDPAAAPDREDEYRSLFEDAPVAYHEIDTAGVVTRVNRAECALLGCRAEEMLGRPVWELVAPEEQETSRESVRRKLAGEQPLVTSQRTYRHASGRPVVTEVHETLLRGSSGRILGIRTCLLDITERKQAEAALLRRTEELARSNAELEQFAYVASHDLQEPLRKIQAFGDRLVGTCSATLPPQGLDYLKRMRDAAGRMQILINDLLSLSRVATQTRPPAPVDLTQVVRGVLSDLGQRIQETGADVTAGPLPVVSGDRVQLGQVLQNLVANALKFRKPDVAPRVTITATSGDDGFCTIEVADNGIGFDEKYADRIFQIFQRLHGRSEYDGTGIGLAICRKVVERHGGSISAHSTPGVGSTFFIRLPEVAREAAREGSQR